MLELPCTHQVLECFDMHEQLALVVVGASSPDSLLPGGVRPQYRLERVGAPFLQRLCWLHVIVPVHQHGGIIWPRYLLPEYHRVAVCFP